jgi:hypothetical protein
MQDDAQWFLLLRDRVGEHGVEAVAAGLELVVAGDVELQAGIDRRSLRRAQQIARRALGERGQRAGRFDRQGVSQTRISTVPNSGLGRISQYRSLMLLTMPQALRNSKCSTKAAQSATSGHWPLSGKAETALRRADWKKVSTPSTKGDEAESAMKIGT